VASRFDGQLRWLHKVRLYPTRAQERALFTMLRVTRELYNALLQQRRDAWTTRRVSLKSREQYRQITELRAVDPRFAWVYRECEDVVLHRLDLAFAAFFRRLKRGETPGYPRFKPASRWNQLEFSHGNLALKFDIVQGRVRVPGVGSVRLRKGRIVPEFGRAFLVTKATHKDAAGRVLNSGDRVRMAAVRHLARTKEREANARRDWLHKVSRTIVQRFDRIALEALRLRSMTRSAKGTHEEPGVGVRAKAGLNRALLDAGFGMLATLYPRESSVCCSPGDRGRRQIQFADVCRVRMRLQGKPGGTTLCLRSLRPRGRCRRECG
jgi:putative transposase